MSDAEPLRRLAELHGIAGGYWDVWGEHHSTPSSSDRALLEAMGVPTEAPDDEIARAERDRWRVGLPGLVAIEVGKDTFVPLVVPRSDIADVHRWSVRGENLQAAGELLPQDLEWREDGPDELLVYRWALPSLPAAGYYDVNLQGPRGQVSQALVVAAPARCARLAPPGERRWGVSLQLYALRSSRNWGIGDFTDLREAVEVLASMGADAVGLNPLHMLFVDDPDQASPYSPSSRRFLNPLYIDVEAVPEVLDSGSVSTRMARTEFAADLAAARASEFVDYGRVARLKRDALRLAFAGIGHSRAAEFAAFRSAGGDALERAAIFSALRESSAGSDPARWPRELRDPDSDAVALFARHHADAVAFHVYLQWIADEQLAAAAARARELGMRVGLYGDLALGAAAGGADVWADPDAHAPGVGLGAPPDDFSPKGQAWGLPPFLPDRLRGNGIHAFAEVVRSAMRHMGAVRLDHVMGLRRLFWVVDGATPADGAYVDYPFEELLAVVAIESERQGCAVIGEDLGTVPDEVRDRLSERGVLSYRVLWFEKRWQEDGSFLAPHEYPEQALATASTHDLPTIAGFWAGNDIQHRADLGLLPSETIAEKLIHERALDRLHLRDRLAAEGLAAKCMPLAPADLRDAVHEFIARTRSVLAMVQIDDILGEGEQANLPGTTTEHPNWRRRLPVPIESWAGAAEFAKLVEVMGDRPTT